MKFGVPKEIRAHEFRVGLTPGGIFALVNSGHQVYVQTGAGSGSGFSDEEYRRVGADVVYSAEEAYGRAEVVLKVSRISAEEYGYLSEGQVLLSFLHLAVASRDLPQALINAKISAIAYELIQSSDGNRPVLRSTSQVAGRLAPLIAGHYLGTEHGGRGILLTGIPGVPSAEVVILGAGIVGLNAAQAFLGLGAQVTILDSDFRALEEVENRFGRRANTLLSTPYNIARVIKFADVLVGAVLTPGQRAPVLLTREMIREMRPRAVFLDFAIDQGGCSETSRPTNYQNPTYLEENVIHYAIPNIPASVPRTASHGLTNAALPYIQDIADLGLKGALEFRVGLQRGLQVLNGELQV